MSSNVWCGPLPACIEALPFDGKREVSNGRVFVGGLYLSLVERYANAASIVGTLLPRYLAECVQHPHKLFDVLEYCQRVGHVDKYDG